MVRKSLTDKGISALKPRAARYAFPDPQLAGHYIRVTPNNAKSYACVARNPDGKQVWTTIGDAQTMPIGEARGRAREYLQRVRDGLPAIAPKGETFGAVAANWIKRVVDAKGFRSGKEIKRLLDRHILPAWNNREFVGIGRTDIATLLDHVEDHHAARQADYCLNVVRSVMNWQAARTDHIDRQSCAAGGGNPRRRKAAPASLMMPNSPRSGSRRKPRCHRHRARRNGTTRSAPLFAWRC